MKLEIDFARPDDLRRTKRELEAALATIDAALVAISKSKSDENQVELIRVAHHGNGNGGGTVTTEYEDVIAMINGLPNVDFNMREALEVARQRDIPESRMRRAIEALTQTGAIRLVQPGQGRRPAAFRRSESMNP